MEDKDNNAHDSKRKAAFRFMTSSDIDLLKEVIHIQPFDAPHGQTAARWLVIESNLKAIYGESISSKGCRTRFGDLLLAFKQDTLTALRASGTDEQYDEREQLLQDIVDLMENSAVQKRIAKSEKSARIEKRESDGEKIRQAAMGNLKRNERDYDSDAKHDGQPSEKKRYWGTQARSNDVSRTLEEISMFMKEANDIKRREIEIAERKLAIEESRLEIDRAEREARFAWRKKKEKLVSIWRNKKGKLK
ncbi:hypothetical protein AC1031_001485 [Aphanomyces cochlioides]|nr:hypothetical protein AC1031_001485 [Aphanomyces cochlioides]